jgi:hypothetical protein
MLFVSSQQLGFWMAIVPTSKNCTPFRVSGKEFLSLQTKFVSLLLGHSLVFFFIELIQRLCSCFFFFWRSVRIHVVLQTHVIRTCLGKLLWLFFKVFFIQKYIKIIFFIFKKLFLTSTHQNDLKTSKKY